MDNPFKKIESAVGASQIGLNKKFAKCEIDNVTINPEECITDLEMLRGDL